VKAREPAARGAAALLLAGPTALAFFTGGFTDEPRLWAGIAAWILAGLGALLAPLPRARAGWAAVAALAALWGWTALSIGWAPLSDPAIADAQRLALYTGALLAACLLLGSVARAVEPALAAGCLVVIGYGLSGRLLPGVIEQTASRTAFGRLEQPLTYWNATGALAAIGLVLAARLAGDVSRPAWMRASAAAGAVPLSVGLALSFSRGAILTAIGGLALLCWLAPERAQLRAVAVAVAAAVPAVALALALDGVRALEGATGARERQGLAMLALLVVAMAAAALVAARPRPAGRLRRPRGAGVAAIAAALLAGLALLATADPRTGSPPTGATASRVVSTDSNRYAYWRVALDEFADHPLRGAGSGAFRVAWRQERTVPEAAVDAHSLYVETLAELGLVGLALLVALLVAVAMCGRRAYRAAPAAAAGPIAALAVWALHAGLDWDWEMPALTLVALALAGLVCALSLSAPGRPVGSAP
jgi:O-Antigen ligase